MHKVNRNIAHLNKEQSEYAHEMSESELLEFVWELTREVWSLSGCKDAELPMDRSIAVFKRKSKFN